MTETYWQSAGPTTDRVWTRSVMRKPWLGTSGVRMTRKALKKGSGKSRETYVNNNGRPFFFKSTIDADGMRTIGNVLAPALEDSRPEPDRTLGTGLSEIRGLMETRSKLHDKWNKMCAHSRSGCFDPCPARIFRSGTAAEPDAPPLRQTFQVKRPQILRILTVRSRFPAEVNFYPVSGVQEVHRYRPFV